MRSDHEVDLAVVTAGSLLHRGLRQPGSLDHAQRSRRYPSSLERRIPGPASGLPYTATLKDGSTFTLNPRVADKLAKGEPINYVFSYGSTAIPLFSPQYKAGYERTLPEAQAILPMNGQAIAPASAVQDVNEQIAQIDALFKADQIDCLSIQSTGTDTFTKITNDIMATGIPVFTVGVQSNGNEFSNFTQISDKEGRQAAGHRRRLHEGQRPRLQELRGLRRRPDPELGAGPDAGLHRRHQGSHPGRDLHQRCDDRAGDDLRSGGDLRRLQGVHPGQSGGPGHRERRHRRRARRPRHRGLRQCRQDVLARLEREHRPARRRRGGHADRGARPAVGRPGRVRRRRLRRAPQERQRPPEHEHPQARHQGERRSRPARSSWRSPGADADHAEPSGPAGRGRPRRPARSRVARTRRHIEEQGTGWPRTALGLPATPPSAGGGTASAGERWSGRALCRRPSRSAAC